MKTSLSFFHPDENGGLSGCVTLSTHDFTAIGIITNSGVSFNGLKNSATSPVLEDTDMVEFTISVPIIANQVTSFRITSDGQTVFTQTCIVHDVRHVSVFITFHESRGWILTSLIAPSHEHSTPRPNQSVPVSVLALIRVWWRLLNTELSLRQFQSSLC